MDQEAYWQSQFHSRAPPVVFSWILGPWGPMQLHEHLDAILGGKLVDLLQVRFILVGLHRLKISEPGCNIIRAVWSGISQVNPVPVASGDAKKLDTILLHLLEILLLDFVIQPAKNSVISDITKRHPLHIPGLVH